jgi:hypothetical protein
VVIENWKFNQEFDIEYSIGLNLRLLNIAKSLRDELIMSEKWKLMVRKYNEISEIRDNDWVEIELRSQDDSDIHCLPNCTLVMRKRSE